MMTILFVASWTHGLIQCDSLDYSVLWLHIDIDYKEIDKVDLDLDYSLKDLIAI